MKFAQFACLFLCSLSAVALTAQNDYHSPEQLETVIRQLQRQYSDWVQAESLTKTTGGSDIWVLTIGRGNTEEKPAIAIAGGIDGAHLLGPELAVGVARHLLEGTRTDSIRQLLESTTFYIFPQLSPDAARQYFSSLKYERRGNAQATDDDRDGYTDEDPYEDLNRDGRITLMRISDPTGEWRPHPADERVLVKANREAGESGQYRLLSEGLDNDRDGSFNEDGPGGIHFNKNFAFNYPPFQPGSGEYAVSEPETRAIADFLFNHWNIFAVLSFGPSDNLSAPLSFKPANQKGNQINGILENDAKVNKMVADLYGNYIKSPKDAQPTTHDGGFMEWAYFHYGRFSFSTPGWRAPAWEIPKDSLEKLKFKPNTDKNKEVNFLRWAADAGLEDYFTPWSKVDHPGFPGQTVEVGGIAPFVQLNPPYSEVKGLVEKHGRFVIELAKQRPVVELVKVNSEKLDNGLWRVKATVLNAGKIPTASQVGDQLRWLKLLRVDLSLAPGQKLISGQIVHLLSGLEAGGAREMSWLIQGPGPISIRAAAPQCGQSAAGFDLK